jgi:hypothetical protein
MSSTILKSLARDAYLNSLLGYAPPAHGGHGVLSELLLLFPPIGPDCECQEQHHVRREPGEARGHGFRWCADRTPGELAIVVGGQVRCYLLSERRELRDRDEQPRGKRQRHVDEIRHRRGGITSEVADREAEGNERQRAGQQPPSPAPRCCRRHAGAA